MEYTYTISKTCVYKILSYTCLFCFQHILKIIYSTFCHISKMQSILRKIAHFENVSIAVAHNGIDIIYVIKQGKYYWNRTFFYENCM